MEHIALSILRAQRQMCDILLNCLIASGRQEIALALAAVTDDAISQLS